MLSRFPRALLQRPVTNALILEGIFFFFNLTGLNTEVLKQKKIYKIYTDPKYNILSSGNLCFYSSLNLRSRVPFVLKTEYSFQCQRVTFYRYMTVTQGGTKAFNLIQHIISVLGRGGMCGERICKNNLKKKKKATHHQRHTQTYKNCGVTNTLPTEITCPYTEVLKEFPTAV